MDRYPILFQLSLLYFFESGKYPERILSYGCSTGEELESIHSYYNAGKIYGIDIDPWVIRTAKKRWKHRNFEFIHSTGKIQLEQCDIIFCLAMLQNTANRMPTNKIATKFKFEQFENCLINIDSALKPGGLLVIEYTDFLFSETKLQSRYVPYDKIGNWNRDSRPTYDRNNLRCSDWHESYRIFIKVS